jgi:brefeldin A-resistance guanine nucleotide exchange factor 1
MGYYSRQTCSAMIRTVFRNVAEQLVAAQQAEALGQVGPARTKD